MINLFDYYFLEKRKEEEEKNKIESIMAENAERLQEVLKTTFHLILEGETSLHSRTSK